MTTTIISVYHDRRLLPILFLGFSSGLPLLLTSSTLSVWMAEAGVSIQTIGLFALVGLPYTLKFLWAPFFDRLANPRRALILTQILLALAIIFLGLSPPEQNPVQTAVLALVVALVSATQDIVIDAFRIRIFENKSYGTSEAVIVLGYRLGMIAGGALALYLATFVGWFGSYAFMASLLVVGTLGVVLLPKIESRISANRLSFTEPFLHFIQQPTWPTLLFIALTFKLGDAFVLNLQSPFLLQLGFSKIDLANVTKVGGLIAVILGGFVGGGLIARQGIWRSLLSLGGFAVVANLGFVLLALAQPRIELLAAVVFLEHFAAGMSTAALVAFISSLCKKEFAATQYALLSALTGFGRVLFSSSSGFLAASVDSWPTYFTISACLGLPALAVIWWRMSTTLARAA